MYSIYSNSDIDHDVVIFFIGVFFFILTSSFTYGNYYDYVVFGYISIACSGMIMGVPLVDLKKKVFKEK